MYQLIPYTHYLSIFAIFNNIYTLIFVVNDVFLKVSSI